MAGTKLLRWGGLVVAIGALVSGGPVGAGTEPPPDIDQEVLDALRAEIQQGFPGESDLTKASEEFGRLVALYDQNTQVGDIGADSELTGLCGAYACSSDSSGALLDAAMDVGDDYLPIDLIDGGPAFTSSNPFKVDPRGLVQYSGFSPEDGDGPENHPGTSRPAESASTRAATRTPISRTATRA